jgi:hypothetical protein
VLFEMARAAQRAESDANARARSFTHTELDVCFLPTSYCNTNSVMQ